MNWIIALLTFLAATVEWVEALTIVLATGLTMGWRPALRGTLLGFLALALIVAAFGLLLAKLAFLKTILQLVIGLLLLLFGLRWVAKAVLRSAGRVGLHDEDQIFERQVAALRKLAPDQRSAEDQAKLAAMTAQADRAAQAVSFQSVLLEGLEVAFIVITFGVSDHFGQAAAHPLGFAVGGALLALVVVALLGAAVHRPLTQVPENTLKYIVGVFLTTFGTFWAGEGLGVAWPGSDLSLLGLALVIWLATRMLVLRISGRAARTA